MNSKMASSGRRPDPIWCKFERVNQENAKTGKARCKQCLQLISPLIQRMRAHLDKNHPDSDEENIDNELLEISASALSCSSSTNADGELPRKQLKLGFMPSVTKTTSKLQEELNLQIGRFFFATNTSFNCAAHDEFIKMITMLRPGYIPPNRKQIGNEILDTIYTEIHSTLKTHMSKKFVCLAIDGWSNIHNDPIICACITDMSSKSIHLIKTIDTTGYGHTIDYLTTIAKEVIESCENDYNCEVVGLVTDNASNMKGLRRNVALYDNPKYRKIITYGCSAHFANLLSKDIKNDRIVDEVKKVVKYFKNIHDIKAKYKNAGGKTLKLPIDVRWNTIYDCLKSFVDNFNIIHSLSLDFKKVFDKEIVDLIINGNILKETKYYMGKLKIIAESLDKLQTDSCFLSDAYEIWKDLSNFFLDEGDVDNMVDINTDFMAIRERYKEVITDAHLITNLLDPRYCGNKLSDEEEKSAFLFSKDENPSYISYIMAFKARTAPFHDYFFLQDVISNTSPFIWWKTFHGKLPDEFHNFVLVLFSCVASSVGLERLFSTFGFVHSEIRNRLGVEKAAKLVTVFKELNNKKESKI